MPRKGGPKAAKPVAASSTPAAPERVEEPEVFAEPYTGPRFPSYYYDCNFPKWLKWAYSILSWTLIIDFFSFQIFSHKFTPIVVVLVIIGWLITFGDLFLRENVYKAYQSLKMKDIANPSKVTKEPLTNTEQSKPKRKSKAIPYNPNNPGSNKREQYVVVKEKKQPCSVLSPDATPGCIDNERAGDNNAATARQRAQVQITDSAIETAERDAWSGEQQKALEDALRLCPKVCPDRWAFVASKVPGKTAKECVRRFKDIRAKIQRQATTDALKAKVMGSNDVKAAQPKSKMA